MTGNFNVLTALAAGILSFLSPCVLPLVPGYISFVSGVSLEEMRGERALARVKWRVVLNSVAFILGFSLVFVSLGASASYLGSLFLGYRHVIRTVGGLFILLVGIYLMGVFKIAALERYLQFNLSDKPAGYLGSVLVGITFAVAWTPCVGPILGAILAIAGVINSAIALYYYVNIIRLMYLVAPTDASPLRAAPALRWALAVCGALLAPPG